MTKSMTGYGKSELTLEAGKLTIEIRTLNAKGCDVNVKTSLLPKDKDLLVRQKIANALQRGTIDFYMTWEPNSGDSAKTINSELVMAYYRQLLAIRKEIGMMDPNSDLTKTLLLNDALRMPEVVDAKKSDVITEDNWAQVEAAIDNTLAEVNAFRVREGVALYNDVTSRVANILALEDEVESLEGERIEAVRARILKNLEDLAQKPDESRFEQEMIFYLEKLDINEEKVRLREHCRYFMSVIDGDENPGKKLGFIIQEMGREINTTGSKANHAGIQKAVVRMKDELEKIREQSMNIL
ncbi:MAG: YicC family protein [Bacteroidales bacterium]|nr:YicC family protein [Bacteroidales bacterium]